MRAVMTTILEGGGPAHDPVQLPVLAICFGASAEPLPSIDQERELRIQAEGLLMQAEMLAWERDGEMGSHGAATRHQARMFELIKGRSEHARAWLAAQKGLPA